MQSITSGDFFMRLMRKVDEDKWTIFTDFDRQYYFNQARCLCGEDIRLELDLSTSGAAKRTMFTRSQANIKVLIGDVGCVASDPQSMLSARCHPLKELRLAELARARERTTIEFPVSLLFGRSGGDCTSQGQQSIRLFVDTDNNGFPDLAGEQAPFLTVNFDGDPPAPPSNIEVMPGNESLSVSWETNLGVADFRGFLVFCSRGEDLPVFEKTYFSDQYRTPSTLCNGVTKPPAVFIDTRNPTPTPVAASQPEGMPLTVQAQTGQVSETNEPQPAQGPFVAPAHFRALDTRFVCSDLLVSQTSARLQILQNSVPYLVGVATIDLHGNASPITSVYLQRPIATRDFYKGYRMAGGDAEGGYCAYSPRRASSGLIAIFAAAVLALSLRTLAHRRRQ